MSRSSPHNAAASQTSRLRSLARRALRSAACGPVCSPNPQVGCVIMDDDGTVLASSHHRGSGTPHAEAAAIAEARAAGADLRGATAIVTLEPCSKTGKTPPCVDALISAGIKRVFYLVADPSDFGGGAARLRAAGAEVFGPQELRPGTGMEFDLSSEVALAERLLLPWITATKKKRPFVTAKFATSVDGRIAARDGSSRWITSPPARDHVHQVRAQVDGILVGTGTVLSDDPELTVRRDVAAMGKAAEAGAASGAVPVGVNEYQPRRIALGHRDIPVGAKLHGPGGEFVHLKTRQITEGLTQLFSQGLRHIVVEGGATVLAAFFRAKCVDEIHHYSAPVFLGAGPSALRDFGVSAISQAPRFHRQELVDLAPDLLQILTPTQEQPSSAVPKTWAP